MYWSHNKGLCMYIELTIQSRPRALSNSVLVNFLNALAMLTGYQRVCIQQRPPVENTNIAYVHVGVINVQI